MSPRLLGRPASADGQNRLRHFADELRVEVGFGLVQKRQALSGSEPVAISRASSRACASFRDQCHLHVAGRDRRRTTEVETSLVFQDYAPSDLIFQGFPAGDWQSIQAHPSPSANQATGTYPATSRRIPGDGSRRVRRTPDRPSTARGWAGTPARFHTTRKDFGR